MKRLFLIPVTFLILAGCSKKKGEDNPPSQSLVSVQGTWHGNYSSLSGSHTLSFTLTQNVLTVSGSFAIDSGVASGSVAGTAGTSTASVSVAETVPCSGTWTGTLSNITGTTMLVNATGTDCGGSYVLSNVTVTKV